MKLGRNNGGGLQVIEIFLDWLDELLLELRNEFDETRRTIEFYYLKIRVTRTEKKITK